MIAGLWYGEIATLNASTLTWTRYAPGKGDGYDEEGWTLLPNGKVLTVDVHNLGTNGHSLSEVFTPKTHTWATAGDTTAYLSDSCSEMGPALLRPDGTVLAFGSNGKTSIYNTTTGVWSPGPSLPSGMGIADGPAAVLPNGNVLVDSSPAGSQYTTCNGTGIQFYEISGSSAPTAVTNPALTQDHSYHGRLLVLPTGQVFYSNGIGQPEIYQPAGTFQSAWQPTITSVSSVLLRASGNNVVQGTQLNGLTQGAAYGDDAQMATNFPLVRITNIRTGHVRYARSHAFSTMGVATGSIIVSAQFDMPKYMQYGSSTLEVVANGIPSQQVTVTVLCDPAGVTDAVYCDGYEN